MAKTDSPDMTEMLAQAVAQQTAILAKLGENTKPYEPGFGDPAYQERLRADGHFDEFPVPVYQNGRLCEPRGLSAQTRERASALVAGKFLGDKVTVDVAPGKFVHLKYKSATTEDRMRFQSVCKDFTDLVDQLWAAQHPA